MSLPNHDRAWAMVGATVAAATVAAAALTGAPHGVQAWSTAGRFEEPVLEAGGGGRFFTGTPADPYTCADCHSGGGRVPLEVLLPQTYRPGATYAVMVRWPTVNSHQVAALLEAVDPQGQQAGTWAIPEDQLPVDALCVEDGFPAVQIYPSLEEEPATDGDLGAAVAAQGSPRQLVGADACGAHALFAHWTAPPTDVGPVRFVGGVVAGNSTGAEFEVVDAHGDAVTLISRQVATSEGGVTAPEIQFGCGLARDAGRRPAGGGFWGAIGLPLVVLWRRRRRRS